MGAIRRHLPPICSTEAFILIVWTVITLPIAAVFLFGKEFTLSDYLIFLLYAGGVGAVVSAGVMFPLALLLEHVAKHAKPLAAAVPLVLVVVSIACLFGRFLLTDQFLETAFGWAGLLFAFSLVLNFYGTVLWIGKSLIYGARKFMRKASA